MTIFEIKDGIFVNLENVFKFEISQESKSSSWVIRFYGTPENPAVSREFSSEEDARDWLSLRVIRSAGANEILDLNS